VASAAPSDSVSKQLPAALDGNRHAGQVVTSVAQQSTSSQQAGKNEEQSKESQATLQNNLNIAVRKDLMPNSVAKAPSPPTPQPPVSLSQPNKRENLQNATVEPPQLPLKQPNGTIIHHNMFKGPSGGVHSEGSLPQSHSPTISQAQATNKVEPKEDVSLHTQTPQNHHIAGSMVQQNTPDLNTPQGPKTKGALKGWSNLRLGETPNTPSLGTLGGQPPSHQKSRPVDTSSTFAAYQKAAKEKADRERSLREQQESSRRQKERSEKERLKAEQERRKEREEEDALEQARRAMLSQVAPQQVNAQPQTPQLTVPPQPTPTLPVSVPPPTTSPVSAVPSEAERARIERERQRQREQERRRREAQQNQIDMNRQSDMMAAFEENII